MGWKTGDKVVFIGHPDVSTTIMTGQPLRVGQETTIAIENDGMTICDQHGFGLLVTTVESTRYSYCPGCFRKPIDFSDLLNVTTEKELELETL